MMSGKAQFLCRSDDVKAADNVIDNVWLLMFGSPLPFRNRFTERCFPCVAMNRIPNRGHRGEGHPARSLGLIDKNDLDSFRTR